MKIKRYTAILLLSLFCISSTVKAAEDINKIKKFIADICLEGYRSASAGQYNRWNKSVRLSIFDGNKKMTNVLEDTLKEIGEITALAGRKIKIVTPNDGRADVLVFFADQAQLTSWAQEFNFTYPPGTDWRFNSYINKRKYLDRAALFIDSGLIKNEKHLAFACKIGMSRIMGVMGKSKVFPDSMFHPDASYTSYSEITERDKKAIVYCLKYIRPKSNRKKIESGVKVKWIKLDLSKKR